MILQAFKKQFDKRHDYDDDELQVLRERWLNISFYDIPTAWIVPIDEMLCKMRYKNPVYTVCQIYGQLIVLYGDLSDNQKKIIDGTEKSIQKIDADLLEV